MGVHGRFKKNRYELTKNIRAAMPRLPAEAQIWLAGLCTEDLCTIETILNIVGEKSFAMHWQHHKDDLDRLHFDLGSRVRPTRMR